MTVSVCMGIYNGENYIEEQLESIRLQTKSPEEVILCDDGSTDHTVEIVRRFISEKNLSEHWKLYCNPEKKGYPGNFYYACSLCTEEVVFLSDQDDIWAPDKIARMCEVFEKHAQARAVCCKFGLIDAEGNEIRSVMAPTHSRDTAVCRLVTVEDVFRKCEWPGMVMAYRRDWYEQWSRGENTIPHDLLIAARAAEEGGFLQLDCELAFHRRHDHNVGGEEHRIRRLLNKQRKLKEIRDYLGILNVIERKQILQTEKARKTLRKKTQSMQDRLSALQSGKIMQVLGNAIRHKNNTRPATMICDLLIVKQRV